MPNFDLEKFMKTNEFHREGSKCKLTLFNKVLMKLQIMHQYQPKRKKLLENINIKLEDEDQALIFLSSLQSTYENFLNTLLCEDKP